MYCAKCGQRLEEGDAFCTYCGEPVPKEEIAALHRKAARSKTTEFDWGVKDEFPEPRKRETMDFNWSNGQMTVRRAEKQEPAPITKPAEPEARNERTEAAAMDPKTKAATFTAEITAAPEQPAEPKTRRIDFGNAWTVPEEPQDKSSELERSLFRDIERAEAENGRIEEKFYTFTQKNEEFQKLLDREYEKVRRNGTPVERPMREEYLTFSFEPESAPVRDAFSSNERKPEEPAPVKTQEPELSVPVTEATRDTVSFDPSAYERTVYKDDPKRKTIVYSTKDLFSEIPGVPKETVPARPADKPSKSEFDTVEIGVQPEEIRTIWEEIRADMERDRLARIRNEADALEAKESAAPKESPRETASYERLPKAASDEPAPSGTDFSATGTKPRPTGEVAAVTATALTKIWEADEEEAEEPERRGGFWLFLFVLVLIVMLLVLAGILIQKFWPDTGAAELAGKVGDWLGEIWSKIRK